MEILLLLGIFLALCVGIRIFPRAVGIALVETFVPGANQPSPAKDARIPWKDDWQNIEERIEAVIVTPPTLPAPAPRVLPWAALPPREPLQVTLHPPLPVALPAHQVTPPAKARVVAPPPPIAARSSKAVAPLPPRRTTAGKLPRITPSPLRSRGFSCMPRVSKTDKSYPSAI